jgi:short-subunit dehydrogenase
MAQSEGTVLITGASSGIGLELARRFAMNGFDLVLVARRKDKLDELAQNLTASHAIKVQVVEADLTRAQAPHDIYDKVKALGTAIDILVNNAGFGARGAFAEIPVERQLDMISVNITALTHLTRLFLPDMLARRSGRILNVASTAAFQPGPLLAVYYATKSFVLSLSEALHEETAGTGVTVTCLCPGPTITEFAQTADMENTKLFKLGAMTAADVAALGYKATLAGKRLVVAGLFNQVLAFSTRLAPRSLLTKIAKNLQE